MNFLSMKYFAAVTKERSFTEAAQKLHITQQTLSAHIAAMEKELGCQLFIRTVPLRLTHAGQVFFKYADQFERLYGSMTHEFSDINADERGRLRIGVAHTRGRVLMPRAIAAYRARYPKMEIALVEDTNDALCRRLRDKELDLLIAQIGDELLEIETCPFYEENVMLLVSRGLLRRQYGENAERITQEVRKTQNIAVLSSLPFLLCAEEDIAGKVGAVIISDAGFVAQVGARADNVETLLQLCLLDGGACFCPDVLAEGTLGEAALSNLEVFGCGARARYEIRFGWLKNAYQWRAVSDFVQAVAQQNPQRR